MPSSGDSFPVSSSNSLHAMGDDSRTGVDVRDRGLPRLLAVDLPLIRPLTFFSDGFACFLLGFTVAEVDGFGVMRSDSEKSSTESQFNTNSICRGAHPLLPCSFRIGSSS